MQAWNDETHSSALQKKLEGALMHKQAFEFLHTCFWDEIKQREIVPVENAKVYYAEDMSFVIAWSDE
jgi:hypothetical protein